MTIESIRFRNEGALLVLQVLESSSESDSYGYSNSRVKMAWRDATTEDLLHVANYTRAFDAFKSEIVGIRELMEKLQPRDDEFRQIHYPG